MPMRKELCFYSKSKQRYRASIIIYPFFHCRQQYSEGRPLPDLAFDLKISFMMLDYLKYRG